MEGKGDTTIGERAGHTVRSPVSYLSKDGLVATEDRKPGRPCA